MPSPEKIVSELEALGMGPPREPTPAVTIPITLFSRHKQHVITRGIALEPAPRAIVFSSWIFTADPGKRGDYVESAHRPEVVSQEPGVMQMDARAEFQAGVQAFCDAPQRRVAEAQGREFQRGFEAAKHIEAGRRAMPPPTAEMEPTPYEQGGKAFFDGHGAGANPFSTPGVRVQWERGWTAAKHFAENPGSR